MDGDFATKACRRAALAVLTLGLYLEATEWIDLYPWNNIRSGNGQETLDYVVGAILLVLVILLWRSVRLAAPLSAVLIGYWGWLEFSTWWIPYFRGASAGWEKTYAKWFAGSVQFLPSSPGHLPPDANHLVLQLLLVIVVLLSAIAAVKSFLPRHDA